VHRPTKALDTAVSGSYFPLTMQALAWGGFLLLIAFFLALDLGVFHKNDETVSAKSALRWTAVWFVVAMLFNVAVYFAYDNHWLGLGLGAGPEPTINGRDAALNFFTGYVVEQSLSLDNIFVIALIFKFFKVPEQYQHRVLFWGILGAVVLRISMILAGAALIKNFHFTIYIFGAILVFTSLKMALSSGDDDFDPEDSRIVKIARKLMPITPNLHGHDFFVHLDGKRHATPLLLVLLVVEGTDVVFAVDSIPAIFGVTTEPFIVFTSNIFAIMGLRSLYFALASLLRQFAYLKYSLIVVLMFVGVKMLVSKWWHPSALLSLAVILGLLGLGVVASIVLKKDDSGAEDEDAKPAN
jgi:tellurite resistance protein TerC